MELPKTKGRWEKAVSDAGIGNLTIHDLQLDSASKIKRNQYLLLRVLWRNGSRQDFDPKRFELDISLEQAKQNLRDYSAWQSYRHNIRDDPDTDATPNLGTFSLVQYYQSQVKQFPQYRNDDDEDEGSNVIVSPIQTRAQRKKAQEHTSIEQTTSKMRALQLETPTKKGRTLEISSDIEAESDDEEEISTTTSPSTTFSPISREAERILYPPTIDEQIVNTALILLLNAIAIHFPLHNDWTPHRRQFTANFKTASFQARTDGYLKDKTRDRVRALIEVKPYVRKETVNMQEAAQMAAWIFNDAQRPILSPGRYFSIAQNRHHIYLIFAEYSDNYLEYLKNGTVSNDSTSFLNMYEFGPWDIYHRVHIEQLGPILLALTVRADRDQQVEYQPSTRQGSESGGESKKKVLFK